MPASARLRSAQRRAFTLIELIVVIAIIIILAAILVPVATNLLGGKSIAMARNVLDGYFGGVRLDAVNRGKPVLVALLPTTDRNGGRPWQIKIATGTGGSREEAFDHGFVAFRIDTSNDDNTQQRALTDRIQYIGRDLIFSAKFRGNVQVHPAKQSEWDGSGVRLPRQVKGVTEADLKMLGIPEKAFLIYVNEDGSAWVAADRAGYEVDSLPANQVDGDLVLTSRSQIGFYDINSVLKIRGRLLDWEEVADNRKYFLPPGSREQGASR